jgi:hypothetical protein
VVSTALSFLAAEGVVRRFAPKYHPAGQLRFTTLDGVTAIGPPNTLWRQWKRTGDYDVSVSFNRYGLRDSKDLREATRDDWFVVGDSYTMGWGVEERERYTDVLAGRIGRRVYNIAAPNNLAGYDALLAYARQFTPNIQHLVIGVCMSNDLGEYEPGETIVPVAKPHGSPLSSYKEILESKSALYIAVATFIHTNGLLRNLAYRTGLLEPTKDILNTTSYSEKALESSVRKLQRIGAGTDLHILILPSLALWVGRDTTPERRVHDRFVALLRERGLRVIDLRPAFETETGGNPASLHFGEDPHWNTKGHALAGRVIAESLSVRN